MLLISLLLACETTKDETTEEITAETTDNSTDETTEETTNTEIDTSCPEDLSISANTSLGCTSGVELDTVEAFLGIPYAKAPIGELRWKRPVAADPWSDIFQADSYRDACLQTMDPPIEGGQELVASEDCLGLNIYRPKGTEAGDELPIMFYIHGGSFAYGSGALEGDIHLADNAIVVGHNYRLGDFGFLAHPALTDEDANEYNSSGTSGNQGLFDSLMALEWVVENAEAFGGDPSKLMIFGESAGALSICTFLSSPLTEGLYSSAVVMSGGCLWISQRLSQNNGWSEPAEAQGEFLADTLSCEGTDEEVLACMRAASAEEVMEAFSEETSYGPNVDGVFLEDAPSASFYYGNFPKVPIFAGITADEGTMFTHSMGLSTDQELRVYLEEWAGYMGISDLEQLNAFYNTEHYDDPQHAFDQFYADLMFVCPTRYFLDKVSYYTNAHAYYHTHVPSWIPYYPQLEGFGAYHSSELFFLFGANLEYVEADEQVLSYMMQSTWTNIANGDATVEGFGDWPLYSENNSVLEDGGKWMAWNAAETQLQLGVRKERCDFIAAQWWGE